MALLAFKALDYSADRIPDRFYEKIPGGFFSRSNRGKAKAEQHARAKSEHRKSRSDRNGRRRDSEQLTDYSDYSDYHGYDDTDYERESRDSRRRRRARSLGSPNDNTFNRDRRRNRDSSGSFDGGNDMDQSQRAPQFPPPPTSGYPQYNPADYAPPPMGNNYQDRRTSSAMPDYGYAPQVNSPAFSPPPRRSTVPSAPPVLDTGDTTPVPANRRASSPANLLLPPSSPALSAILRRSPFQIPRSPLQQSFSPSYDPPLAAILSQSTNPTPQPSGPPPSSAQMRYTPAGYAPSPANAPPQPGNPDYAPYNPAQYAPPPGQDMYSNPAQYHAPGNAYPSPPPLYRHQSRSQPALDQYPYADSQQLTYPDSPGVGRHGSVSSAYRPRKGDDKRHRARSADHRGRSHSRVTDKFRDRFEDLDLHDKNLAASVGGALAGGLAGRAVGKGTLSTLIGAAIGGFGGSGLEKKIEK